MSKNYLIKFLIINLLFIFGCKDASEKIISHKQISTARQIANASGFSEWEKVNSIAFTFNVKVGNRQIHRSWFWEPKKDIVTFYSQNKKDSTVFSHGKISINSLPEILKLDKQFINDSYWLLFPFHLVWDDNVDITFPDSFSRLPIGKGQALKVVVKYTSDKGYTPNDIYDLYIGNDYKIIEWAYHNNGSITPNRVTKWEDYKKIGHLTLSLNRPSKDNTFRVWFTNVEVK